MTNYETFLKLKEDLKAKASMTKADIWIEQLRDHDGYVTKTYTEGCVFWKDDFTRGAWSDLSVESYNPEVNYSQYTAADASTMRYLELELAEPSSITVDGGQVIQKSDIWDWRKDYPENMIRLKIKSGTHLSEQKKQ